jgi:integrase
MAYFRKRSGAWEASIEKKGFPRISRTFDTKAEAEAWARQIEGEMDRGVFVSRKESENTTLSEALDRYISEILPHKKQLRRETNRANALKRWPISNKSLAQIQGKDIAAFRDERVNSGCSANTVRLDLALLSHLFTIAVKEWGMAGLVNPVMQIRKPKLPRGRDRRLLPGELERIVVASESPVLSDVVRFAIETGMRRGELSGMTWQMVDLKKRTVTLQETKNGEKRVVPLSTEAVRILSGLLRRIDGEVWGMEPDSITQAYLRAVSRARKTYEKECEKKGEKPDPGYLVDLTFHDLRHEATSRLFEKGFDTMEVRTITGHKTLQMLARYTHLRAEDLAERMK